MTLDLSNLKGIYASLNTAAHHLKPPEKLLPHEWAERKCRIPAGNALPGPVRFRNAPYQIEPLDIMVNPDCYRITLMWGAQVGKTQLQLMAKGYFIDHEPSSQIMMQPSETDLKTWLNAKFEPMVNSTPSLLEKIAKARGRDGVNNQTMKQYPGGFLMFAWSGSPKTQRGRSAPKIFCDETDGYERSAEGHPVSLLWQRAATFGDQRLLNETSTPTIKGSSHIESSFEEGDQRRWYCPCPDCGEKQYLKWGQVNWQKDEEGEHLPETAAYVCEHCGSLWDDAKRYNAIRAGEWIAKKPFKGHASYHIPELASCFRRLKDVVLSFLEKKAMGDLQTFVNVSLAETWEEEGTTVDHSALYMRREYYPAQVPAGGLVLTCAVDVQDDRLEVKVKAHGHGEENWTISYVVFRGDPARQELWNKLKEYIFSSFEHESGVKLKIACTVIDSGGHYAQQVYNFVKPLESFRVYAIKGSSKVGGPIVSRPSKSNYGKVNLFSIGTDTAKELIYKRLTIAEAGPGYMHFPQKIDLIDEEYFLQLTAEKLVTRYVSGQPQRKWIKTRPRNEALDLEVYNVAALYILNPNYEAIQKQLSQQVFKEDKPTTPKQTQAKQDSSWLKNSGSSWL